MAALVIIYTALPLSSACNLLFQKMNYVRFMPLGLSVFTFE
jgi:hypothetical protein